LKNKNYELYNKNSFKQITFLIFIKLCFSKNDFCIKIKLLISIKRHFYLFSLKEKNTVKQKYGPNKKSLTKKASLFLFQLFLFQIIFETLIKNVKYFLSSFNFCRYGAGA